MPGSEIHAQLLENLKDQTWLRRPSWAAWARGRASSCCLACVLIWATPRWKPRNAALLAIACVLAMAAAAYAGFHSQRQLFDAATPGVRPAAAVRHAAGAHAVRRPRGAEGRSSASSRRNVSRRRWSRASFRRRSASRPECCRVPNRCATSAASISPRRWFPRARSAATSTTFSTSTATGCSSWSATSPARDCRPACSWRSARRCTRARRCARRRRRSAT